MTLNPIDMQMVGYPDGWYVFDDIGSLVSGPWPDEQEADADVVDGEWVGHLDAGIVDISYAPDNIT